MRRAIVPCLAKPRAPLAVLAAHTGMAVRVVLLAAALHSASAAQLTQPHIWVTVADGIRARRPAVPRSLPPCPRWPAAPLRLTLPA
jgi:hypothetical protein